MSAGDPLSQERSNPSKPLSSKREPSPLQQLEPMSKGTKTSVASGRRFGSPCPAVAIAPLRQLDRQFTLVRQETASLAIGAKGRAAVGDSERPATSALQASAETLSE
jgi:hypothetical protein